MANINGTPFNDNNTVNNGAFRPSLNGTNSSDIINGLAGDDLINGGGGDDILNPGPGFDTLIGGSGFDQFRYDTGRAFTRSDIGADRIDDFAVNNINGSGADLFILDKQTFTALDTVANSSMNLSDFAIVNSDNLVGTSNAAIVYNPGSGNLFYNQNESAPGVGTGGLIAVLTGSPDNLSSLDFFVQA